jgi:hypothetical protein
LWHTKAKLTLDVVTEILYQADRKMFLAAYLPGNEAEETAATEAKLHGKMSTERALGKDVPAYLLRSAFPLWHKEWICRLRNNQL